MIAPPTKRPRSNDDSVLPLINIVFLLLIFFMLAGVLTQKPPFELKAPSTAETQDQTQLQRQVLEVAADGRFAFAGKPIQRDELSDTLTNWPDDKPLQIRADASIKANELTGLFAALRRAGVSEVNLLTRHEQQR